MRDNFIMTNSAIKERTLTPQEVRTILNADNKEILELCKKASILPRKNSRGLTYFSYDEVKNLRKVQAMKKNVVSNPISAGSSTAQVQPAMMQSIMSSLKSMETSLSERISKVIDEKLEGMDEVVVELIRCKTDNETLRQKVVDLNKEIYRLKSCLNSYKPVGLGFYVKKEQQSWE